MFQNLEIFQMSHAMAKHAGQRQAITARNVANADTPGYRAQDITPFDQTLRTGTGGSQRATRAGHLNGTAAEKGRIATAQIMTDTSSPRDPNGNSVAIETEILRSVESKRQHDRALAIYRSSLKILRSSLGRA